MSFGRRSRAEAEVTNRPRPWRRTRPIPALLIDFIGRSEEPELIEVLNSSEYIHERNVCAVVVQHILQRLLLLLLLLGYLVYTLLLSLAVTIYLCLMVLRRGNAGALSA